MLTASRLVLKLNTLCTQHHARSLCCSHLLSSDCCQNSSLCVCGYHRESFIILFARVRVINLRICSKCAFDNGISLSKSKLLVRCSKMKAQNSDKSCNALVAKERVKVLESRASLQAQPNSQTVIRYMSALLCTSWHLLVFLWLLQPMPNKVSFIQTCLLLSACWVNLKQWNNRELS